MLLQNKSGKIYISTERINTSGLSNTSEEHTGILQKILMCLH